MSKRHKLQTGWWRSPELVALAKPPAVLLALMLSLSVHINASLAAGADNVLCVYARIIDNSDSGTSSPGGQIEHCSLCTNSLDGKVFGQPPQTAFFDLRSSAVLPIKSPDNLIFATTRSPARIRAPPFS